MLCVFHHWKLMFMWKYILQLLSTYSDLYYSWTIDANMWQNFEASLWNKQLYKISSVNRKHCECIDEWVVWKYETDCSPHLAVNFWEEEAASLWLSSIMWNILRPWLLCLCQWSCQPSWQKDCITSLCMWGVLLFKCWGCSYCLRYCVTVLGYCWISCHFPLLHFHFLFWEPLLHHRPAYYQLCVNNTHQCYVQLYTATV